MKSVAIIVLNYQTAEMTAALAGYLRDVLVYSDKEIFIVDNGSAEPAACATHRLQGNLGFTRGMYEGYKIARAQRAYDAYWFLNSDVGFEHGDRVLLDLIEVLFSNPAFAQIAPQHNSPHVHMRQALSWAQEVPFLEPTATLIKAETIEKLGFWDCDFTLGWGIDYDYGWRIRQAGMQSILTSRARVTHKGHGSQTDHAEYGHRAQEEMITGLRRKYGDNWARIYQMGSAPAASASGPAPRELHVCAIFRNEARYLREWIEFHLLQGVAQFHLYQNRSDDDWQRVLAPYVERGLVEVMEWPVAGAAQIPAYADCLQRLTRRPLWLAIIDIDEFLFSPRFATVPEALATLPGFWGAVGVNWIFFGSSGEEEYRPGLVIERFTWRPCQAFAVNTHIKTIMRMDQGVAVRRDAHFFNVERGTFDENGKKLTCAHSPANSSSLLRINHYGTKSRQEYYDRIALGRVDGAGYVARSVFDERQARDVDDRTIQRFLPALKARLEVEQCQPTLA